MTAGLNANVRHQNLHPANKFYTRAHQPVPQTFDKKCDSRLNSSVQNISSLALYTLAAVAAQSFPAPAWAKSSVNTTDQPDSFVPTSIEPTETYSEQSSTSTTNSQSVASPESIGIQEFAPEGVLRVEAKEHQISSDLVLSPPAPSRRAGLVQRSDINRTLSVKRAPTPPAPPAKRRSMERLYTAPSASLSLAASEFSGEGESESTPTQDASTSEMTSPTLENPRQVVPIVVSAKPTAEHRQPRAEISPQNELYVNNFALEKENKGDKEDQENIQPVTTNLKTSCRATQQTMLAQASTQPAPCQDVNRLQEELRSLDDINIQAPLRASPALSIVIPTAYGAHRNTGFVSATYQERTRYSDVDDGALGIGIGLGDAEKSVGVELSYTLASFGANRDFGSGGFNLKVHRRLPQGWAVAAGWNGLINLGDDNDFEQSVYGVVSKIIRTREDIHQPFSRVAITAGIGNGQFRTEDAVDDDNGTINVFGNVAVRVAEPVSLIAEWTGQDLGVGVSIAPFKNIPLVITPALRDITGAGDGTRFVLGAGLALKF